MKNYINTFLKDESGAVTVDWVVLTASIVGLGIAVITVVGTQATSNSDSLGTFIDTRTISTSF